MKKYVSRNGEWVCDGGFVEVKAIANEKYAVIAWIGDGDFWETEEEVFLAPPTNEQLEYVLNKHNADYLTVETRYYRGNRNAG